MADCSHVEEPRRCRLKLPGAPLRLQVHMELFARGHVGIGVDDRCPFPREGRRARCPFYEP